MRLSERVLGPASRGRRRPFRRVVLLTAGLLVGAAATASAEAPVVVRETKLLNPPDSHEPQRALADVRNTGPNRIAKVKLTCTFMTSDGSVLDTQDASLLEIAGGAEVRVEVIGYGWPRADRAACRLAELH